MFSPDLKFFQYICLHETASCFLRMHATYAAVIKVSIKFS